MTDEEIASKLRIAAQAFNQALAAARTAKLKVEFSVMSDLDAEYEFKSDAYLEINNITKVTTY